MLHIIAGYDRSTRHHHATVEEARECEYEAHYEDSEPPACPICDAIGCNGARGMGCDRYERLPDHIAARDDAEEAAYAWR